MRNKQYTDILWMQEQILAGRTFLEIATQQQISTSTCSRYFKQAIEVLTIQQLLLLSKGVRDIKTIISPKTSLYKTIIQKTSFLPRTANIRERLWYIETNSTTPPKCKMCNSPVAWDKNTQAFRTYCSGRCQGEDPTIIIKRESTTFKKRGVKYWNQHHIPAKSLSLLQNKHWLINQHIKQKKSLIQIGSELDVHPLLPAQYLNRYGVAGQQNSYASQSIEAFIREHYHGEIIINSRKIINPLELDIFLPEKNLAIEYNGLYWHSEIRGKHKNYHLSKTNMCVKKNIHLIHIFENEWLYKQDIVKSRLKNLLGIGKKVYARKCIVKNIDSKTANIFFATNHIQGVASSKINIGLFFNDELMSVMSFTPSRFNKHYQYELIRFATQLNTNVVGGASKIFQWFIREYTPKSIISYSDKRWNTGTVYKKLNFKYLSTSAPNYWYFKNNELVLYSRMKFQKHKLFKLLKSFDPNMSEWKNMVNNGYNRIWDCGNDVWVWSS